MHKSKKAKVLAALSVAAAVGTYGHVNVAKANMLTQAYNGAFVGNDSAFDASSGVTLNQAAPAVTLTVGESFEFGIGAVLTNNAGTAGVTNPVSGTNWDKANQKKNKAPAISPILGLSTIGYEIDSSDVNATMLQPILSTDQNETDPNHGGKEIFNSTATLPSPSVVGPSVFSPGSAEQGLGAVGTGPTIAQDWSPTQVSGALNSPNGNPVLADFAGTSTSADTTVFSTLGYSALKAGTITITPVVSSQGTAYWAIDTSGPNNGLGSANGTTSVKSNPTYKSTTFGVGDTVVALAPLVVTILASGPTGPTITLTSGNVAPPAGLAQLVNGASSAQHGQFTPNNSNNVLTVTGSSGNYLKGTVNNIGPSAQGDNADYVAVGGFNPNTDTEIYALKLDEGGTALTPTNADVATIIADINTANDTTFGVTQLASTAAQEAASNPAAAALFPGYDVFLTIPTAYLSGLTNGTGFNFNFGFNFGGYTDGSVSNITVTDIGLVPEPGAMLGVLSLGAVGMFSYRRRKPEVAKA